MKTERRTRCRRCKDLKTREELKIVGTYSSICPPCYEVELEESNEHWRKHAEDEAARRKALTPQDHIEAARETLSHLRKNDYGLYDAHGVMVSTDALEFLLSITEAVLAPLLD